MINCLKKLRIGMILFLKFYVTYLSMKMVNDIMGSSSGKKVVQV